MKLISVIIPIYNVEDYIDNCFDSIYNQELDDNLFEVIAVNDGSTDDSSSKVKQFQMLHQNITLIEKENGGVSSARNKGLEIASGKYVIFVDPDDELIDGSLSQLALFLDATETNIIICKSFLKNGNEVYKWIDKFPDESIISANDALNCGYVRGSVCGCAILLSFLRKMSIVFFEGMKNGEDTTFLSLCIHFSNHILFKNIPLYRVVGRHGSASRTFSINRLKSNIESIKFVEQYVEKIGSSPILEYLRYRLISELVDCALKVENLTYKEFSDMGFINFKHINTRKLTFQKNKVRLLNFSKRLFYILCKIKRMIK